MNAFVSVADRGFQPDPSEPIMDSLFQQYERVIFESIITSFGLDLFIKDQHGGDVDTILNVRQIGTDAEMTYKNVLNQSAYENRPQYNYNDYHGKNETYGKMKSTARDAFHETGTPVTDIYTGKDLYFYSRSAAKGNADKQASIDHILTAHTIAEDRGRVLSELKGEDLANSPDNLVFTNAGLNSSMGATKINGEVVEIPKYLELHPEIAPDMRKRMMDEYARAQKNYEVKIARAYYTSPQFITDSAKAAGKLGVKMGARQVWGFIFAEIWFAERDELQKTQSPLDPEKLFTALGIGVKRGVENAKSKYKDLIQKFIDGTSAGILASLTTTLCNIFFTTAKHAVRIIRQSYASLTQAMNVLFLNPEDLLFGERMRATSKILATGASIVLGTLVSEALEDTGVGKIPVVGEIITTFCGSLVSGIMTCSLLYFLDRSELINNLAKFLDKVPTISQNVQYFRQQAEYFKQYAAELMKIDLKQFMEEINQYETVSAQIQAAKTENELNRVLHQAYTELHITLPWEGDFSTFMANAHNHMVFE